MVENSPETQPANPALKELDVLIGNWRMDVSNASFLPDPSDVMPGFAEFAWIENGAFIILRQSAKDGPPLAHWLIGADDSNKTCTVLYYDNRSVSRIYEMRFADGVWKLWRDAPGFPQRFEGAHSPDGKIISGRWEKSPDGKTWEHDFDLTYTRVTA